MTQTEFQLDFGNLLSELADIFKFNLNEVSIYAAQRAAHLATLSDDDNYMAAVKAETDNIVLKAATSATAAADGLDLKLASLVQGALYIGVASLR